MNRKPNLFIIGAMKSGTSSLHVYLGEHPEIFMCPKKEPRHFSRVETWSQGIEQYLALFSGAKGEIYVGESDTENTKRPHRNGVAKRLHEFNPEARIIYVMRDPFDRIVSQYKHMVRAGVETRTLSQAVIRPSDYLTNSYYAYQLRPYLELFGPEAIFLERLETLRKSPAAFCRRLFSWLQVDDSFVPPSATLILNASPPKIRPLEHERRIVKILLSLKGISILKKMVPRFVQESIYGLLPKREEVDFSSEAFRADIEVTREALRDLLCEWIRELEVVTGLSFDDWPSRKCQGSSPPVSSRLAEEIHRTLEQVLFMKGANPAHSPPSEE